jgi:hypothetical protein
VTKNNKALLEISQWIEYRKVEEDRYVYIIGDPVDCFYVLVKGEVHLTAPEKTQEQEEK